jgi:hypothetical protein
MKLSTGINILSSRNVEKNVSKKILLANTADKKNAKLGVGSPSDPIFFSNSNNSQLFNPDIRFRNNYGYSPLTNIDSRNQLLLFGEQTEIKKAVKIIRNEIIVTNLKSNKYPLYPKINLTTITEDKQETAKAIQKYLDEIFYPKLYQMFGFKKDGIKKKIDEYLKTGKLAYEIVYDNLKRPKDIVNIIPLDPSTLQKFKENDYVYFVQRPIMEGGRERILHENQVILIEWNEFDFGYVSYVDQLRRPFNIMRSMQSAKILWFAVKSQVRMHIKLNLGDVPRSEAIQKLSIAKNDFSNYFEFDNDSGTVLFNGAPDTSGYHEFYTAETANSGSPEIEEVNTQGPDLTEVDSLQFWEKLFWKETEIPYDRIDPNSSETWGFVDISSLKKTELNFSKFIEDNRDILSELILKPIIIQLTLKEIEIGIDLSLLDSILIEWVAFNQHEKLAELEVLNKKIELATNLAAFGVVTDVNGTERKMIPVTWIRDNYLDYTQEQLDSMEEYRKKENVSLGFNEDGTEKTEEESVEEELTEEIIDEESADDIMNFDDSEFQE